MILTFKSLPIENDQPIRVRKHVARGCHLTDSTQLSNPRVLDTDNFKEIRA